jgi:hypothetical protein
VFENKILGRTGGWRKVYGWGFIICVFQQDYQIKVIDPGGHLSENYIGDSRVDGRLICRVVRNVVWAGFFDPGLRPACCGCEGNGKSTMDG